MNRRQRRELKRAPLDLQAALDALGPCPDYGPDVATIEQAAIVARARVAWQHRRAGVIEQYRRRSRITDVEVLQAMHSPTVEISVDDNAGKRSTRANITRVRQSEAWRHNLLTPFQRQAEFEIAAVWRARAGQLGVKTASFLRIPPASSQAEHVSMQQVEVELAWLAFLREAKAKRVHVPLVLRLLTEPVTLAQAEFDFRLVPGEAFKAYVAGLDLWCSVRGWAMKRAV